MNDVSEFKSLSLQDELQNIDKGLEFLIAILDLSDQISSEDWKGIHAALSAYEISVSRINSSQSIDRLHLGGCRQILVDQDGIFSKWVNKIATDFNVDCVEMQLEFCRLQDDVRQYMSSLSRPMN